MQSRNALIITLACLLSIVLTKNSAAQSQQKSYSDAYDICKPKAHSIAREQCDYGRIFEHYYLHCLKQVGFKDEKDLSPDEYEQYLESYGKCQYNSDVKTKQYCNYGVLYKIQYDKCMLGYNFDENGDYTDGNKNYFKFDF